MPVVSESLGLPPSVSGKVRNFLDLSVEKVCWKTSKSFHIFNLKLLWWGESKGTWCEGITIDATKGAVTQQRTIRYQIRTSQSLWLNYLKNCEPLRIEIYSSKTSDFIGSAKIEIPKELQSGANRCEVSSDIFSIRDFKLGEISVRFETHPGMSIIKNPSKPLACSADKENLQIVGKKKQISFRDPKPKVVSTLKKRAPVTSAPLRPLNTGGPKINPVLKKRPSSTVGIQTASNQPSERSILLNYLGGRQMTQSEELEVIQKIATISPSHSMIESLNLATSEAQSACLASRRVERPAAIKITISQVELNSEGRQELQKYMNKSRLQNFVFKCAVTSKSFKEDICFSPVFESAPQEISFNKQINQQLVCIRENKVAINFGFCIRSIDVSASLPSPVSFFVGFSRLIIDLEVSHETFHKRSPIMSEKGSTLGTLKVKIEFSTDTSSFHVSEPTSQAKRSPVNFALQRVPKCHPSHSNDRCENGQGDKSLQLEQTSSKRIGDASGPDGGLKPDYSQNKDTEMVSVDTRKPVASKIYSGLLFIEELRNNKEDFSTEYFVTYEGFWNQCQEVTENSIDQIFNYLKQFPVNCNESFLQQVKNNHLELKLWEKTDFSEKLVGTTKIPLHQFFIAFRDAAMIDHLSGNQLPIISFDNWANFVTPLSNELMCQGKILLAIGSESQINYLKLLRKLERPKRTKIVRSHQEETTLNVNPDHRNQMKNKLTAFIESLSQKLPEASGQMTHHKHVQAPSTSTSSTSITSSQVSPHLKKTSDLLETLQKALSQPPKLPPSKNFLPETNQVQNFPDFDQTSDNSNCSSLQEKVQVSVNIEYANHLPKVVKKKQNRRKNSKTTGTPQKVEFEPSAYATFESCLQNESSLSDSVIKSHEGIVHCTFIQKGCDVQWNQTFDVHLFLDIFTNPQKKFIVKVWRKASQESEMKPTPFTDAVIGFSAVDLSVLMTGLPILSGFYNIIDFSGKINGQIKLSITPKESLTRFATSSPEMNSLPAPLNISDENGPNLLSRTLKRKFTELDEITQRLKARLLDVTGDENSDPDEEFERDLNTCVDEGEDERNDIQDFAWLSNNDSNGNNLEDQLSKMFGNFPSTSGNSTLPSAQRQVSGCSNSQPMAIDQLLKKYDLDSIINPNIFRNILDPSLANSDSTPTLNPRALNTEEIACESVSGESGDTTVSSILSNDQMQTIQSALQKTTLGDSEPSSSRKDPDGENNISE